MKSVTPFLEYAQKRCGDYGVSLVLVPRRTTKFGDYGEFDDVKKRMVVCVNDPGWLTTLAHELGHMDQWLENTPAWAGAASAESDAYTAFDDWIVRGKKTAGPALQSLVRRIQRCELDAERRALRLIRKYGLADPKAYAQVANFHVWQYEAARRFGRWVVAPVEYSSEIPDRLMRIADIGKLPAGYGLG